MARIRSNAHIRNDEADDDSSLLLEHVSDLSPENKCGFAEFREASSKSLGRVTLLPLNPPLGG